MHHPLPDRIHRLFIIPDASLIKFDHNVKRPLGSILIRVLQKTQDKPLQFLVYSVVLCIFIDFFEVCNQTAVEEFSKLFVLASKQLEKYRQDNDCLNVVLSTHDLEARDQSHSNLWVQNCVVLLQ